MNDREKRPRSALVAVGLVARHLGLTADTVARLIEMGLLQAYTEPESGVTFVLRDSMDSAARWLKEMPALLRETDAVSGRSVAQDVAASAGYDAVVARLHTLWDPEVAEIWLESPNAHLNGATPLEVLRQRGLDQVLRAIEAEAQGAYAGGPIAVPLEGRPASVDTRGQQDEAAAPTIEQSEDGAAALLDVPVATVRQWVRSGYLKRAPSGRIRLAEIERIRAIEDRLAQQPDVGDMTESETDDLSN